MRLVVARIGRAHGVKGEVTVEVRTDVPERRFVPGAALHTVPPTRPRAARPATGGGRPAPPATLTVVSVRDHNGTLLLRFAEAEDRGQAEALRDVLLEVDVAAEPAEDDAWYDHELVGLRAEAPDATLLGEVVAVQHAAQDLLVVRRPDGAHRLVPFVAALVPTVDVAAGRLVVDAPPGLLDDTHPGDHALGDHPPSVPQPADPPPADPQPGDRDGG